MNLGTGKMKDQLSFYAPTFHKRNQNELQIASKLFPALGDNRESFTAFGFLFFASSPLCLPGGLPAALLECLLIAVRCCWAAGREVSGWWWLGGKPSPAAGNGCEPLLRRKED